MATNSPTNDEQLIQYYQNLLILQYKNKNKPKAKAHVRTFLSQIVIFDLLEEITKAFNIETATGDPLTRLGDFVGVPREVKKLRDKRYFGVGSIHQPVGANIKASDNLVGFTSYYKKAAPGKPWTFSSFFQYQKNELQDSELRQFIHMKIAVNTGNCSLKDINDFFRKFFGGSITVRETAPMTLEYGVEKAANKSLFKYMSELDLYPRPEAVSAGTGFVIVRPKPFVYAVASLVEEISSEPDKYGAVTKRLNISENVLGYLTAKVEPIGVYVQQSFVEGEDYENI